MLPSLEVESSIGIAEEFAQSRSLLEKKNSSAAMMSVNDEVKELARKLHWSDNFFNGEDGVIAVFDFDYALIAKYRRELACLGMGASIIIPPFCILGTLLCFPCFYSQQINWDVYSQHVAITQDGIKFVHDKRKTLCGCSCTDKGKMSKTVPFDKITDCDVTEPAGATCCCVTNVLSVVHVDTASSGVNPKTGGMDHELALAGLKEPDKFKKLVWAMKRAQGYTGKGSGSAAAALTMDRGFSNDETNSILREIRTELRQLNANLKTPILSSSYEGIS